MENVQATTVKTQTQTLDLVYVAMGAALIAICSWISIPTTVPFTLQTFAVFLLVSLLGGKRGSMTALVYMLLGVVGLPVFAGFSSGVGALFGAAGGYIVGFLFIGIIYLFFTKAFGRTIVTEAIALVLGLAACYAFGTAWFINVYSKANGAIGIMAALGWCVFPFIIPDLLKLALALIIARRIRPVIK